MIGQGAPAGGAASTDYALHQEESVTNPNLVKKYTDQLPKETEPMQRARDWSTEVGVDAVAASVGAQLAVLSAACRATSILEVGTGTGVSGLWLLQGSPGATLTSIDLELEHQQHARRAFTAAGVPSTRARLITGDAAEVLPRMNEGSYDIVLLDAGTEQILELFELALTLVRIGGTVCVHDALLGGSLADPAQRGADVQDMRALISTLLASNAVATAINPAGDGLLMVTRLPE